MRIHLSLLVLLANLLLSRTSDGRANSASSVEAVTPVGTGGPAVDANSVEEATAEGTGGSVIIATSVEEANEDPIHPIELIQIGARSTPPVAPFAAQSVVLSRSQLKLEALAVLSSNLPLTSRSRSRSLAHSLSLSLSIMLTLSPLPYSHSRSHSALAFFRCRVSV